MILIADRFGQLGNRLWTFAHWMAWGIENGARIANPGFHEYGKYFDGTAHDPWCRYPKICASRLDGLAWRTTYPLIYFAAKRARKFNIRTSWIATRNIKDSVFDLSAHTEELVSSKLTAIRGWRYQDAASLAKHQTAIRRYFVPRAEHRQKIGECIASARARCEILVGVHIRRGDYISHLDGGYFYDHAIYRDMIEKVRNLFVGRDVGFLICSNEPVDGSVVRGLNYQLGPNHIVEDMYSFACCDYLVGPPSTYSMWASFYGRVPLFEMRTPFTAPQLSDFRSHSIS